MTDVLNGAPRVYVLVQNSVIRSAPAFMGGIPILGDRDAAIASARNLAEAWGSACSVIAIPVEVVGIFAPDGTETKP